MTKDEVFNELAHRNIARVEIDFSGGNDEGGVDSIRAYDADDNTVTLPSPVRVYIADGGWYRDPAGNPHPSGTPVKNPSSKSFAVWVEATPGEIKTHNLMEALEQPIYSKYYSFAGGFEVYGTITWNVMDRTVVMDVNEASYQYENFRVEF